jgi:hypothetical protein
MKVNIRNLCTGLELMNGRCFSTGIDWVEKPDERVDAGSMMSVELLPSLATFEGILTYELGSEYRSFDRQRESTLVQLFVIWKSEGCKRFRVLVHLIEYDEPIKWKEIKLEEYYQRRASQLSAYNGPIKDTWLMHDGTVLMTRLELNFTQRDGVLNITISEGVGDDHTKILELIDPKR